MKKELLITCLLVLIGTSCKNEGKHKTVETSNKSIEKKGKSVNLNISVLLDLSDRIDTIKNANQTMQYYQRDLGYIQSISNAFIAHMEQKKIRTMNDKIPLFFDPEPKNPKINAISKNLKFHLTKENATIAEFQNIRDSYQKLPKEIYEQAIADGKFIGSDTWSFFKNKIEDHCIDESAKNVLIVITDGYMFHKDNQRTEQNRSTYLTPQRIRSTLLTTGEWENIMETKEYGFISAKKDLNALEVLVLGVNPVKGNVYEEDIVKAYWGDWFEEMNIGHYEIKDAGLPADMDKIITTFLLEE